MSEANNSMCCPPGHFSWNELMTSDAKASADFYGKLLGWQTEPFTPPGLPADGPPYLIFKTRADDQGAGGMMQMPAPGIPTHWVPYVAVENIDHTLAKAAELGAKTLAPLMVIPGVGRVAVIQDPLGATFGLHEPAR